MRSNSGYDKRHRKNKESGLCPNCGKERPKNRITCEDCRSRIKGDQRKRREKFRELIFNHYGSTCDCCGENKTTFLAIDHLPGTSREGDQRNLTEWIIKNNFPEGFRILCHNCNMATRWGRICPHKE